MKNLGMPPYCNTGAQNTSESVLSACLDWLQVTFLSEKEPLKIISLFSLINTEIEFFSCSGQYGYKKGVTNYSGIFIFWDGSGDMGVHLQITGKGCRFLEGDSNFQWHDFFQYIDSFSEYNITRIDIAIDDYNYIFSIDDIQKKIKKGECISRFKKAITMETIDIGTGSNDGKTIYFGKPSSRLQIRFYEKNKQLKAKGYDNNIDKWNRYEIQTRKERAEVLFQIIKNNSDITFINEVKGILNQYISFRNRTSDTNKSRWPIWSKWKKFIGEVEKIRLTKQKLEKDIYDSYDWFMRQVAPTYAMLQHANMIDDDYIIENGTERLKDIHIKKIMQHKKNTHEMGNKN